MYKKIIAGLGGAIALNLLHETIRKNFDNVPQINKVGEEALNKALDKVNTKLPIKTNYMLLHWRET